MHDNGFIKENEKKKSFKRKGKMCVWMYYDDDDDDDDAAIYVNLYDIYMSK